VIAVPVRLNGALAAALGPRVRLDLDDGASVRDLVAALGARAGLDLPAVAVSIGGRLAGVDEALAADVEVAVLLPVAGGCR
jgi:molybdopterin converting factor small subunit